MAAVQAWFAEQLDGIDGRRRPRLSRPSAAFPTPRGARFGFGFAPDGRSKLKSALAAFGEDQLVETGMLIQPEERRRPSERGPTTASAAG